MYWCWTEFQQSLPRPHNELLMDSIWSAHLKDEKERNDLNIVLERHICDLLGFNLSNTAMIASLVPIEGSSKTQGLRGQILARRNPPMWSVARRPRTLSSCEHGSHQGAQKWTIACNVA